MEHFDIPIPFTVECPDGRSSTELSLEFGYTCHYQGGAGGPARPLLSTIHVPSASPTCAAAPAALPWGGAGCELRAHFLCHSCSSQQTKNRLILGKVLILSTNMIQIYILVWISLD